MSIKEIAEKTGASQATVSRVLNNANYHCRDEKMQKKIWDMARQLNYSPNQAARNLRLGEKSQEKVYVINVLITRMNRANGDPFFEELLRVVQSEIHRNMCILQMVWYNSVFSNDKKCQEINLNELIREMYEETEGKSDGILIIGKCNQDALKIFHKTFKNIVSLNRNSTNYKTDEVTCDGKKISTMAIDYLLSLGHKKIAYIGTCHNETRYRGYLEILGKQQIDIVPEFIIETNQTELGGLEAAEKLMKLGEPPTAIYCANDISAIGVLKFLNKSGKYFKPSVIGSDDIEQAQYTNPMLTTIRLPKKEMGRMGVMLLIDRIEKGHESIIKMELEGQLIIRGSCLKI